jgi:hypothetical protein
LTTAGPYGILLRSKGYYERGEQMSISQNEQIARDRARYLEKWTHVPVWGENSRPVDYRGRPMFRKMGRFYLVDLDWITEASGGFMMLEASRLATRETYSYGIACLYPQSELDVMQRGERDNCQDLDY